ncbi:uncharacterized protein LOC128707836 [Anopheles marshallii]|uniref:uncharacterized protein LOC128707836 n=1 Tax=Anopheles marshallii TaxID=1521116 RepID=UPI00237A304C|nr:uncharacterized protein LOC128707836 [Anopheles marshallii]
MQSRCLLTVKLTWWLVVSFATVGHPACKAVAIESPEPASLLRPRDVNPHPYQNAYDGIAIFDRNLITNSEKFTENLLNQGPIQFPRLREGSTVNALPYPYETLALKERRHKMVRFSGGDSQAVKPAYQALAKHAARVLGKSYAVEDIDTYNEASTNLKKNYVFSYAVKDTASGDDFSHTQQQQQDGAVKGSYKVQLPDGRMQIVKYIADNNGYRADVTYENEPAGLGPASQPAGPVVPVATGAPNSAAYQTYYAPTAVQQPQQQYLAQIRPARLYYAAPNPNQIPAPFYPTQLRPSDVKIHSYNTAPHAGAVIASTTTQATPASGAYLATFPASGNLAYIATSATNGPIGTVQLQPNGGGAGTIAVPVTAIPLAAYRDINVPPPPPVQPLGVAFASAGRRTTVYADGARVSPQGTLQQTIYQQQPAQAQQALDYGYVQIPVDNRVYKRDTDRSTEVLPRPQKLAKKTDQKARHQTKRHQQEHKAM